MLVQRANCDDVFNSCWERLEPCRKQDAFQFLSASSCGETGGTDGAGALMLSTEVRPNNCHGLRQKLKKRKKKV